MDKGVKKVSKQRNNEKEKSGSKSFGFGYRLQCFGNREIQIEGCRGILKYEQEEIRLNVGTGEISITGNDLSIPALERNFVQIRGRITQIEFI